MFSPSEIAGRNELRAFYDAYALKEALRQAVKERADEELRVYYRMQDDPDDEIIWLDVREELAVLTKYLQAQECEVGRIFRSIAAKL